MVEFKTGTNQYFRVGTFGDEEYPIYIGFLRNDMTTDDSAISVEQATAIMLALHELITQYG